MRICINASAANQGGSVTHLLNLLPQLAKLDSEDRYLVLAPRTTLERLDGVLSDPIFDSEEYPFLPAQLGRRIIFDQFNVPALARRYGADLLFSSNGFGTLASGRPEALLVRNSIYFSQTLEEKLQELGRSRRDLRLRRAWTLLSIKSSSGCLFPSKAMQNRVEHYVSLAGRRAKAIHYGFDRDQFFTDAQPEESVLAPMRSWSASGRKILLYVSGYAVHKNFETAIEALASLLAEGVDVGLVLTAEWKPYGEMVEFDAMMQRIRELGIEQHIQMTGLLPWSQLHAVYSAADIHLWPSFLESFGHPMLEAMASGLPSVAADTEINREILCEAGVYFDPFDPLACAGAIREALEDSSTEQTLQRAAEARSMHFSWATHAESLRAFFADLAPGMA